MSSKLILLYHLNFYIMKKKLEFWFPLLAPAFLFAVACEMFNWSCKAQIDVSEIIIGSILFIAVQAVLYKLLHHKTPDVLMRTSIPLAFITAFAVCYVSGILSPVETKIALIFLGVTLMVTVMVIFQGKTQ